MYEDSTTALELQDFSFSDRMYFSGSVRMNFKLEFNVGAEPFREDTVRPAEEQKQSAEPVETASWSYCADPLLGSSCAPTSEEAFGGSWVPGSGEWGGASPKYAMRILGNTSHAVLCEAGSPDCPSCLTESELVFGDNGDLIRDKDNVPIPFCPCKTAVCYTLNGFHRSNSRVISGNGDLIKSRNWFEVYEVDNPTKVEQIGFIELVLDTSGGGPTYPVHHSSTIYGYPMNRGSSFNWFRFSPLNLEAGKPQPLPAISCRFTRQRTVIPLACGTRALAPRYWLKPAMSE